MKKKQPHKTIATRKSSKPNGGNTPQANEIDDVIDRTRSMVHCLQSHGNLVSEIAGLIPEIRNFAYLSGYARNLANYFGQALGKLEKAAASSRDASANGSVPAAEPDAIEDESDEFESEDNDELAEREVTDIDEDYDDEVLEDETDEGEDE